MMNQKSEAIGPLDQGQTHASAGEKALSTMPWKVCFEGANIE